MSWRNLLLRAYPRSWREEYGEEFAGLLAQRRLTLAVVADVLGGATRQHLHRDEPWKICGAGLFLWTCLGLFWGAAPPFCWIAVPLTILVAGTWAGSRKDLGVREAIATAGKVVLAGVCPDLIAGLLRGPVTHNTDGTLWYQWGMYFGMSLAISRWDYLSMMLSSMLFDSALFGLVGAIMGRFVAGLREGLRQERGGVV
jgi:hypothetical protein